MDAVSSALKASEQRASIFQQKPAEPVTQGAVVDNLDHRAPPGVAARLVRKTLGVPRVDRPQTAFALPQLGPKNPLVRPAHFGPLPKGDRSTPLGSGTPGQLRPVSPQSPDDSKHSFSMLKFFVEPANLRLVQLWVHPLGFGSAFVGQVVAPSVLPLGALKILKILMGLYLRPGGDTTLSEGIGELVPKNACIHPLGAHLLAKRPAASANNI